MTPPRGARVGVVAALLLALVACGAVVAERRRRRRIQARGAQAMPGARPPADRPVRLSVVLPAYEEARRLEETVPRLRRELLPHLGEGGLEILVVDDGSRDGTAEAAERAGADRVLVHPENRGKGAAVRTGMLAASGRSVAFTDADLAYAPDQLLAVLAELEAGWDVVIGCRRHPASTSLVAASRLRAAGSRLINWLAGSVLVGRYRDTQSGLKGFHADVARQLFSRARIDGMGFDIEVLHLVERDGLSLQEVPVRVSNSPSSSVRVVRDGLRLVSDLWRIRRWAHAGVYGPPDGVR